MNSESFAFTGNQIVSPNFGSHRIPIGIRLGGLLAAAVLGTISLATTASAAITQARVYQSPASAPSGGLWLNDASGGHLWISDHLSGFCRVDITRKAPKRRYINQASCYNFGLGGAAGQAAFDPVTNFIYLPDLSSKSEGITRLEFDPATGTVIPDTVIAPLSDVGATRPGAVALGPDGNLYVSSIKNSAIVKITNPGCVDNGRTDCASIQRKVLVGRSSDKRGVAGMTFVGNDLYLAESSFVTRLRNATLCRACIAIQAIRVPQPESIAYDGKYLYMGNTTEIWRSAIVPGRRPSLPVSYATGFSSVSGLAVKKATRNSPTSYVFAGDDLSNGISPNTGRWWMMPALR